MLVPHGAVEHVQNRDRRRLSEPAAPEPLPLQIRRDISPRGSGSTPVGLWSIVP